MNIKTSIILKLIKEILFEIAFIYFLFFPPFIILLHNFINKIHHLQQSIVLNPKIKKCTKRTYKRKGKILFVFILILL